MGLFESREPQILDGLFLKMSAIGWFGDSPTLKNTHILHGATDWFLVALVEVWLKFGWCSVEVWLMFGWSSMTGAVRETMAFIYGIYDAVDATSVAQCALQRGGRHGVVREVDILGVSIFGPGRCRALTSARESTALCLGKWRVNWSCKLLGSGISMNFYHCVFPKPV